jgi:hypothetical protein
MTEQKIAPAYSPEEIRMRLAMEADQHIERAMKVLLTMEGLGTEAKRHQANAYASLERTKRDIQPLVSCLVREQSLYFEGIVHHAKP